MHSWNNARPAEVVGDEGGVFNAGICRIILGLAPIAFAEAAHIHCRHLAVPGQTGGDAGPIVRIEIIGAMHGEDRQVSGFAIEAVKYGHITALDAPGLVFGKAYGAYLPYSAATTGLDSVPRPVISISHTSPGSIALLVPGSEPGVPVTITSPGCKV